MLVSIIAYVPRESHRILGKKFQFLKPPLRDFILRNQAALASLETYIILYLIDFLCPPDTPFSIRHRRISS